MKIRFLYTGAFDTPDGVRYCQKDEELDLPEEDALRLVESKCAVLADTIKKKGKAKDGDR